MSCPIKSQRSRHSQGAATVERPLTMPTCSYLLSKIPHSIRLELFNDDSQQTQTLQSAVDCRNFTRHPTCLFVCHDPVIVRAIVNEKE